MKCSQNVNCDEYIERNEIDQLENYAREYIKREQEREQEQKQEQKQEQGKVKAFISISGLPGCGKSELASAFCVWWRKKYGNRFICQIDISDCADEIDVYQKIAQNMSLFYKHKKKNKEGKEAIRQLLIIYDWIYGERKKYTDNKEALLQNSNTEDVALEIIEMSSDKINSMNGSNLNEKTFYDLLEMLANALPFGKFVIMAEKCIRKIRDNVYMQNLLRSHMRVFTSRVAREEIIRQKLLEGFRGLQENPCIILDNFQLNRENSLGRDHTWLTKPGGLMAETSALWIVVSRMQTNDLFCNAFEDEERMESIVLQGFTENQAKDYLKKNCFQKEDEKSKIDEIQNKMIAICGTEKFEDVKVNERNNEDGRNDENSETETTYLPYLLKLVVEYYRKLKSEKKEITEESFEEFRKKSDFIGYYFYANLTEAMTYTFQILSCLDVWDAEWIEIIREKFDNYLLYAHNLLVHMAPIEELGNGRFKLHEAIKDGLYDNESNYIKRDILKFLADKFFEIYGGLRENQKEYWYQTRRLQEFAGVTFNYVDYCNEEEEKDVYEKMNKVMERILDDYIEKRQSSEAVIGIYSRYIDYVAMHDEIPCVKVYARTNWNNLGKEVETISFEKIIEQPEKIQAAINHISRYLNLTKMFSNISESTAALELEKVCVDYLEKMLVKISGGKFNTEFVWGIEKELITAKNALAYDYSADHQYEEALELGQTAINELKEVAREIIESDNELKDMGIEKYLLGGTLDERGENFDPQMFKSLECPKNLADNIKKCYFVIIEKWMKEGKESKAALFADLILTDQQNLRGNLPWYHINNNWTIMSKEECIRYGIYTYWMRKARLEALGENLENMKSRGIDCENWDKQYKRYYSAMQLSRHNVCVYCLKAGDRTNAMEMEEQILNENKNQPHLHNKLTEAAQSRWYTLKELIQKDSASCLVVLWKRLLDEEIENETSIEINEETIIENCIDRYEGVLEDMQYLGDNFLQQRKYKKATEVLGTVLLLRYILYGTNDSKTLDTTVRLLLAAYGCQNEDKELKDSLYQYVKSEIVEMEETLGKFGILSRGIHGKINQIKDFMKQLEKCSDERVIYEMVRKCDHMVAN